MGNSFIRPIFVPDQPVDAGVEYLGATDDCGAIMYPDGSCYYGGLQMGMREGFGILIASDGYSLYEATWHVNEISGQCRWSRPDGTQVMCQYTEGRLLSLLPLPKRVPPSPSRMISSFSSSDDFKHHGSSSLLNLSTASSMYIPRSPSRPDTWLIDVDALVFERRISSVSKCQSCPQTWKGAWLGKDVAIRSYANAPLTSDVLDLLSKIAQLRHPTIALFMGAAVDRGSKQRLCIVTEWIGTGSLAVSRTIGVQTVFQIAKGISVGCAYLRKKGFAHKNLKPSNILIDPLMDVKLSDYYAREFALLTHPHPICCSVESAGYLAPESLRSDPFVPYGIDTLSDVYSFGVIMEELVGSRKKKSFTLAQIRVLVGFAGIRDPRPLRSLSKLVRRCQSIEPQERTSFDRLVAALNTMHSTANSAAEDALITFISGR